jgi:hypothetical protein
MTTNVNIHSAPSKVLRDEVHTFVNRRLQQCRGVARFCGQLVSAFGVVGFSGVKDSRKSVHIAEASASAGIHSANSQKMTQEKQSESNPIAEPKQNRKQSQSKAVATAKRNDSKQGATCTPI